MNGEGRNQTPSQIEADKPFEPDESRYPIDISDVHLRRRVHAFASLVEEARFGIYTVDSDFCLRNVSVGALPAFSSVHPLIGRNFEEVMRIVWVEPFASEAIRIFRHTLETGESYISPGLTEEARAFDWDPGYSRGRTQANLLADSAAKDNS